MPRITPEEYERGIAEIEGESHRAAAIVAATLLEATLEDCVVARLRPMSNTHRERLLGGESDFARFSAKIELGFSLGLYGQKTRTDLHYIRKIRNEFAHYADRSFDHPRILAPCSQLTDYITPAKKHLGDPPKEATEFYARFPGINARWRYLSATVEIGLGLLREALDYRARPPRPTILP